MTDSKLIFPAQELSVIRAVVAGHALVSGGVVAIVAATMALGLAVTQWPPVLLAGIGCGLGWPWWSATVPRWWRWALDRGVDPYDLQEAAEAAQLVWPRDSLLAKTEFGDRWAGIDRPVGGPLAELREQLLGSTRAQPGLDIEGALWGVVSEFGYQGGTATLVAFDDGSVSMYTGDGGGLIDADRYESVRVAADRLIATAAQVASQLAATTDTRLPEPGEVSVFLLFADRVLGVRAFQSAPAAETTVAGALYGASRGLLDALRETAATHRG